MDELKLLEKIRSRGFWRINIRPITDKIRFARSSDCLEFMKKNQVEYDGMSYPFYNGLSVVSIDQLDNGLKSDYAFCSSDYGPYKEYWRLYRSGQFIHYMGIIDDWWQDDFFKRPGLMDRKPFVDINYVYGIMLPLTQIFEFMKRLSENEIMTEGLEYSIDVSRLKGRTLWIHNNKLLFQLKPSIEDIFKDSNVISPDEILFNSQKLSLLTIARFYELFNWVTSIESLKVYQDKLIKTGNV